jgi:hypothetical protein
MSLFYKQVSRCLFSNQNYCVVISLYRWSIASFRVVMRIVGPLMLLLANVLLLIVYYVFLKRILFQLAGDSIILYGFHLSIGTCLIVNVIFNLLCCAFTAPGSPEPCPDPGRYFGQITSVIDRRVVYQIRNRLDIAPAVSYRYCKYCKAIKPPRAHHCR